MEGMPQGRFRRIAWRANTVSFAPLSLRRRSVSLPLTNPTILP